MPLSVVGFAWIEDQRSSVGTDHLVPLGAAIVGADVHTVCGLDLVAHAVKEASENGRMTQTGGGFDVGDDPHCGNVTCKACLDQAFQAAPIPNGSERRRDGKSKR